MERWVKAFKSLRDHLAPNVDPDYNFGHVQQDVQGIEEFDFGILVRFLEEIRAIAQVNRSASGKTGKGLSLDVKAKGE